MEKEEILKEYGDGRTLYKNLNFHIEYILIDVFFAYELDGFYHIDMKWKIDGSLLNELTVMEYKNMKFKIPKDVETYLENIYLDWRTPTVRKNCRNKAEYQGH